MRDSGSFFSPFSPNIGFGRLRPKTSSDEVERQMTLAMDLEGTRRMDWFFDEWVRETGIPHYSVKFEVKPRGNEFLVTGTAGTRRSRRLIYGPCSTLCSATRNKSAVSEW